MSSARRALPRALPIGPAAPASGPFHRRLAAIVVTVLVASVVALVPGALGPAAAAARHGSREARIRHADRIALRQIGDPYRWGATGPRAFDCSGLVLYATHRAGFPFVPRVAAQQAAFMRHIPRRQLRRGDFMFFYGRHRWDVYHVAFFQGWRHGRAYLLAAPHTGARVRREPVWTHRWFAGTLRFRHPHAHHRASHRHPHRAGHRHRHYHRHHHRAGQGQQRHRHQHHHRHHRH